MSSWRAILVASIVVVVSALWSVPALALICAEAAQLAQVFRDSGYQLVAEARTRFGTPIQFWLRPRDRAYVVTGLRDGGRVRCILSMGGDWRWWVAMSPGQPV